MDIVAILISQYLASLKMLEQTILLCPDEVWDDPADKNRFWHLAYHALHFVEEYLSGSPQTFRPWAKYRAGYEEFPLPEDAPPYDKETVLEYLAFCRQHIKERLPQIDLGAMEKHPEPLYTLLELQIYNIRHLMQHIGEMGERLGSRIGADIDWVGKVRD
jgi:hypothetical protein